MLKIIGLIVLLVVIGAAIYYFGFYKKVKQQLKKLSVEQKMLKLN
mgnify:CR=1 FL=1